MSDKDGMQWTSIDLAKGAQDKIKQLEADYKQQELEIRQKNILIQNYKAQVEILMRVIKES